MSQQQPQLPLFKEIARKSDAQTSHDRAEGLTNSLKLTKMITSVMKCMRDNPNTSARDLGVKMVIQSGIPDHIEWPHKVMSRLVTHDIVLRTYKCDTCEKKTENCKAKCRDKPKAMLCSLTELGKRYLEGVTQ